MIYKDLVVIGGGAAGLSAAVEARKQGIEDILVLERSSCLGGILRQCIHNGFGVHKYREDLTGVEFAARICGEAKEAGISCLLNTFALDITPDKRITAVNPERGLFEIKAGAIILAMGCRERSRGALMIPGKRCAGVITAGTAQNYLNLKGYLPGRRIVILGSGDIGLIMARQFVIEGAAVERVVEIMPYSSGLARNISQCLEDFGIPVNYNSTIVDIQGKGRVEQVTMARVDENRRPVPGTEETIACDTLLISAGLIPENELSKAAGIELSPNTRGAVVDDGLMTSADGIFSCGNVLHVHDLVDFVSEEGTKAGASAALYLHQGGGASRRRLHQEGAEFQRHLHQEGAESRRHLHQEGESSRTLPVEEGFGVSQTVPQRIRREGGSAVEFMFRPKNKYTNCTICVDVDGLCVKTFKRLVVAPGEMCSFKVDRHVLTQAAKNITVRLEVL